MRRCWLHQDRAVFHFEGCDSISAAEKFAGLEVQVPLATYTGWGLRRAPFAANEDCALTGQYIPFRATAAQRDALRRFGLAFGTAYQVWDDCVDLFGSEVAAGKSLGTDLAKGIGIGPELT